MTSIEQAIFTSAETERSAGYQLVARSPGVCEADAGELAVWGPSHDSLLDLGADAVSTNFHPLPSGAYCVSRTTNAGWEYSGRGGHRVYTQCLVVPAEVLLRFANNPFALLRAVQASGMFEISEHVPRRLEPLWLAGGAAAVDQTLLVRLGANPGSRHMAGLVQAALGAVCLAVAGTPSAESLIAGLLNCLPVECRCEFSFSTGLKFSSRRPFRMVALSDNPTEKRWLTHQTNVTVFDPGDAPSERISEVTGWARLIERVLTLGRTSFLSTQLSKPRGDLALDDLDALGLQLLEDLEAAALRSPAGIGAVHPAGSAGSRESVESVPSCASQSPQPPSGDQVEPCSLAPPESRQLAHAAHRRFEKTAEVAEQSQVARPATTLQPDSPEVVESLERLDDLVYGAISGDADALRQLEVAWPQLCQQLGIELLAESREQYLRYALSIWDHSVQAQGVRDVARAASALDVLCVLFDEV